MNHPTHQTMAKQVEIFVSYSHENDVWLERLRPVLKFNQSREKAYVWNDQVMKAGDRWDKEIREALDRMDVFVCLVSFEFLASSYIRDVEIPIALERAKDHKIEIVPIVLFPMSLDHEHPELNAFNPLPCWGKCWLDYQTETGYYQAAHMPIREGIRDAIEKVNRRSKP